MDITLTKGERTRQAILQAAYKLFIEQGYHATSMRQIASQADVALGGIYNHFSCKEQIFEQVLLDHHPYRQVLTILQSSLGDTVEDFTRNAARTIIAELGHRPDFLKLAFIELSEFKGTHATRLFQTIFPQFIPLLQRFTPQDDHLRDIPAQVVLLSFLSMFFAFYLTETVLITDPPTSPPAASIESFLDVFLHGILKPEMS